MTIISWSMYPDWEKARIRLQGLATLYGNFADVDMDIDRLEKILHGRGFHVERALDSNDREILNLSFDQDYEDDLHEKHLSSCR